ncbi:hypothetical protein [Methanosarcina horonobensis]|nr:hypothetical protein [Methanosarcina horonobensis]
MDVDPRKKNYGHRFSYGGSMIDRSETFNITVGLDGKNCFSC